MRIEKIGGCLGEKQAQLILAQLRLPDKSCAIKGLVVSRTLDIALDV